MQDYEEFIVKKIGTLIKSARKEKSLSQKELASGICSQAMISSIENSEYLPNTALFLALCNKLNLSVDVNFLNRKLHLDCDEKVSDKLFSLCKSHQYQELLKYLDNDQVLSSLKTNLDYQTYYYYHGCAIYQINHDLLACKRDFTLALSYSSTVNLEKIMPKNEIELLLLNSLGVVKMELFQEKEAEILFDNVNKTLEEKKFKSENLNVLFFQQGMVKLNQRNYSAAIEKFINGIHFLERNGSTYMLNSYLKKLTECHQKLDSKL